MFLKTVRCLIIGLFIVCFQPFNSYANQTAPDTVTIGSYIISLHDINFKDKEYTIRFWLWMLYNNKEFDFENRVEVPNAKSIEKPDVFVDSINGQNWVLLKMKCVMKQAWKVNDFPFDKQSLIVKIENSAFDNTSFVFKPDNFGKHVDPHLAVDGWQFKNMITKTTTSSYNTAFGDRRLQNPYTEYDCYEISFDLQRDAWGLFLKIFIGMYVAFMIGYVSFFIHVDHIEASFGLQVGGLFAAVGNKYITDSALPETSSFTLVDSLHALTFIYLFIIIFISVIVLLFYKKKHYLFSNKIIKVASIAVLGSYILLNLILILSAIHDVGFN
ncbi:MAG: hypothetical protein EAZ07_05915 [Cytophagales bacterium]|nr:MAG: hypothetical protein EAZ07_05915 [Cytophagales bacterium]